MLPWLHFRNVVVDCMQKTRVTDSDGEGFLLCASASSTSSLIRSSQRPNYIQLLLSIAIVSHTESTPVQIAIDCSGDDLSSSDGTAHATAFCFKQVRDSLTALLTV
jgi:hypothetical protein